MTVYSYETCPLHFCCVFTWRLYHIILLTNDARLVILKVLMNIICFCQVQFIHNCQKYTSVNYHKSKCIIWQGTNNRWCMHITPGQTKRNDSNCVVVCPISAVIKNQWQTHCNFALCVKIETHRNSLKFCFSLFQFFISFLFYCDLFIRDLVLRNFTEKNTNGISVETIIWMQNHCKTLGSNIYIYMQENSKCMCVQPLFPAHVSKIRPPWV